MAEPAIHAHQLTKVYGGYAAVDHLDLNVAAGTVVSVLGPNGAGKTTLVRMLATLVAPTSGSATVCGHDIVKNADGVRSAMSLTGQFAAMEDNLTARENLLLMAQLRGYHRQAAGTVADASIWPRLWWCNRSCRCSMSRPPVWTRVAASRCGPRSVIWSTKASR